MKIIWNCQISKKKKELVMADGHAKESVSLLKITLSDWPDAIVLELIALIKEGELFNLHSQVFLEGVKYIIVAVRRSRPLSLQRTQPSTGDRNIPALPHLNINLFCYKY